MINNSKVVAIIPARGGSERIPNKNIKSFAGQPIISYSIKAAQKTDLFDPDELTQKWIHKFCNVNYKTINSQVDRILSLGKYTITIKKKP